MTATRATAELRGRVVGGRELFVYYRVAAASARSARAAVDAMHTALRDAHPGLEARLLRRSGGPTESAQTWMETYARPAMSAGVDAALQQAIDDSATEALAAFVDGSRHVEVFEAFEAVGES